MLARTTLFCICALVLMNGCSMPHARVYGNWPNQPLADDAKIWGERKALSYTAPRITGRYLTQLTDYPQKSDNQNWRMDYGIFYADRMIYLFKVDEDEDKKVFYKTVYRFAINSYNVDESCGLRGMLGGGNYNKELCDNWWSFKGNADVAGNLLEALRRGRAVVHDGAKEYPNTYQPVSYKEVEMKPIGQGVREGIIATDKIAAALYGRTTTMNNPNSGRSKNVAIIEYVDFTQNIPAWDSEYKQLQASGNINDFIKFAQCHPYSARKFDAIIEKFTRFFDFKIARTQETEPKAASGSTFGSGMSGSTKNVIKHITIAPKPGVHPKENITITIDYVLTADHEQTGSNLPIKPLVETRKYVLSASNGFSARDVIEYKGVPVSMKWMGALFNGGTLTLKKINFTTDLKGVQ